VVGRQASIAEPRSACKANVGRNVAEVDLSLPSTNRLPLLINVVEGSATVYRVVVPGVLFGVRDDDDLTEERVVGR
jgi:hypothetical protein